jgi:hypothetical protein
MFLLSRPAACLHRPRPACLALIAPHPPSLPQYWPEKALRICITGCGGFIAAHLGKRLKSEGHYIIGADWKRNEHFEVRRGEGVAGWARATRSALIDINASLNAMPQHPAPRSPRYAWRIGMIMPMRRRCACLSTAHGYSHGHSFHARMRFGTDVPRTHAFRCVGQGGRR